MDPATIFPPLTIPVRTLRDWTVLVRMVRRSAAEIVPTLSVVGIEFDGIGHSDEIRQVFEHRLGFMLINFQGDVFFLEGSADVGPTFSKLEPMLMLIQSADGYWHVPDPYLALRQIEEGGVDAVAKAATHFANNSMKLAVSLAGKGGRS